ncbi:MAG: hypothetical protein ACLUVC_04465 [Longibaculum sp.]
MKIIACVDQEMGLMFHQRRQSQDRIVREKIKELNEVIYMNEYSYSLYKDTLDHVVVDENYLKIAGDHYCLIEDNQDLNHLEIEEIILFQWNRVYPKDVYLNIDLSLYHLVSQEDFQGSSHEITKEVYRKE